MTRHTFDITVTGERPAKGRLTQTVSGVSMPKAIIVACHLVVEFGAADSAMCLLIKRREA